MYRSDTYVIWFANRHHAVPEWHRRWEAFTDMVEAIAFAKDTYMNNPNERCQVTPIDAAHLPIITF